MSCIQVVRRCWIGWTGDITGIILQPISAHGLNAIFGLVDAGKVVATLARCLPARGFLYRSWSANRRLFSDLAIYQNPKGLYYQSGFRAYAQTVERKRGFKDRSCTYPHIMYTRSTHPQTRRCIYFKNIVLNEDVKGFCTDDVYIAGNVWKSYERYCSCYCFPNI